MREEVIITSLFITTPREIKNFQIRLPYDAIKIIGIELGARRLFYNTYFGYSEPGEFEFEGPHDPSFHVRPNKTFGEITLQTPGKENIFFRDELKEKDSNIFFGDFSNPQLNQFKEWTHGKRREEVELQVEGNAIVEGCYKDRLALNDNFSVIYMMYLYLWIEKELQNDNPVCP